MVQADEFHKVAPNLLVWSAYDPSLKCDLSSSAFLYKGGLILIDPIALSDSAWEEACSLGEPRAILLTNENHSRASDHYRKKHRIPVVVPSPASKGLDIKPDVYIHGNEILYGLTPIAIPGASLGETAFASGDGIMIIGDALINLQGLALLPDKYCVDARQSRASLAKLLDWPMRILTFAHGSPIVGDPGRQLSQLLKNP